MHNAYLSYLYGVRFITEVSPSNSTRNMTVQHSRSWFECIRPIIAREFGVELGNTVYMQTEAGEVVWYRVGKNPVVTIKIFLEYW